MIEGHVIRVIDGDTIVLAVRVRLPQNAPELSTAAGIAARARLAGWLHRGDRVSLNVHATDSYGRIVADVSREGGGEGG